MKRRRSKSASRLSVAAPTLAAAALAARLLVGCGSAAPSSSVFGGPADTGGDAASVIFSPLPSDGGPPGPSPSSPQATYLPAGPPVVAPVCQPSVERESCEPPESTYALPATITVTRDADAGCRQAIHAETRDGGAFACVIGTTTACYGPLALGTKYPFNLSHSSAGGAVSGTFNVRFDGDGGVPATVAVGGCFEP